MMRWIRQHCGRPNQTGKKDLRARLYVIPLVRVGRWDDWILVTDPAETEVISFFKRA
jgi:hypothetical protein